MRAAPERRFRDPRLDPMSPERVALRAMLRYDPDDNQEAVLPPRPERPGGRKLAVLGLGLVETVAVGAAVLAWSMVQVSSPTIALPAQERLVAAFTEVDALVEVRRADLEGQVARGAETIGVPDFPARAAIPRGEAVDADGALDAERLTSALLSRAAAERYADPSDDLAGASADPLFSALSRALSADGAGSARDALMVSGAVALALGLLLGAIGGRRGWTGLGLATLIGGLVAAGVAFGLDWLLVEAATGGALRAMELSIAETLLGIPLRNGLIAAAAGLVIGLSGLASPRTPTR